ncbi:MAG TPA: hypothetical protein VMY40_00110 [Anaerolineae bacterium]|nr:hypothetical protein [Anaerolineae bacterium]
MTAGVWFALGVLAMATAILVVVCVAGRQARKLRYHAGVLFLPEREMLKRAGVGPIVPKETENVHFPLLEELGMVEKVGSGRYAVTPFGKEVGEFIEAKESYRVD